MKNFFCNECGQEAHWQGMRFGKRITGLTKCQYHKPSPFKTDHNRPYYVLLLHCHCWKCHKFTDPDELIFANEKGELDIEYGKPYCTSCLPHWYDPEDDATNEITGGTMTEGDDGR